MSLYFQPNIHLPAYTSVRASFFPHLSAYISLHAPLRTSCTPASDPEKAEAKFKKIARAYEVLSDEETRRPAVNATNAVNAASAHVVLSDEATRGCEQG